VINLGISFDYLTVTQDLYLTASLDWSYLLDPGVPALPHHEGVKNTAHCHQWKEAGLVPGHGVPSQRTSVYLRSGEETIMLL